MTDLSTTYRNFFTQSLMGSLEDSEIEAFLSALAAEGNPSAAVSVGASVLKEFMTPLTLPREHASTLHHAVDIVGVGGDGHNTYSISTTAAIVVAASGVTVLKHGNRAASSMTGSADTLESVGYDLDQSHDALVEQALRHRFAFMFAPRHHPAMRHVAKARRSLGHKTVFNFIGPLCNPAGVTRYLLGCGDRARLRGLCDILMDDGASRVWGVCSHAGMDELGLEGPNTVVSCRRGQDGEPVIEEFALHPADVGLHSYPLAALQGTSPAGNSQAFLAVLNNAPSAPPAYKEAVIFNAGAALHVATDHPLQRCISDARHAIDSGATQKTLLQLTTKSPT
ncbi:MAG: anthranilate phosphoribosyltransferase [Alphaproteobacteria bacterium]|nr:anthranilate phosphoribosyltransferase [Alphaproteobacteria bacterium]